MPAMATPGIYRLGDQDLELTEDGRVVLAGKPAWPARPFAWTMRFERYAHDWVSLVEAISMATRNPARVGRIAGRQRGIASGERADMVLFRYDSVTSDIKVVRTIVGGEEVYSSQ